LNDFCMSAAEREVMARGKGVVGVRGLMYRLEVEGPGGQRGAVPRGVAIF